MFTGIVQGTADVVEVREREAFRTHVMAMPEPLRQGLKTGASVAHNGVCLTVTAIEGDHVHFDLMRETLRVTNLGDIVVGSRVNIERAARFGDEIGGHAMSGHVMDVADVLSIEEAPDNRRLWFSLSDACARFVFDKGYVGLDGISLTVGEVRRPAGTAAAFCVDLIPETLARTTLGDRVVGDAVNIEIDPQTQAIVETAERFLQSRSAATQ